MDAETEQDPFVSITTLCQPTASQEARFPNCPFARESENFADSNSDQLPSSPDPTPSQPSGIVMVSPPGSITSKARHQAEDDAVFHTPPEDQNLDELSSDGVDVGDRSKTAKVSEFGGETVPTDETEAIVDAFEGSEGVPEAEVATSNLAGDSVDVVSVGKIDAVRKNGELSEDGVPEVNGVDGNHKLGKKCGSMVNKGKRRLENSCLCTSLDSVKSKEDSVELKCTEVVKDRKTPNNGALKTDGKRIETIDDFRYVGTGIAAGGIGKRRQLPVSLEGKGKNAVETGKSKSGLFDFLDVLKVVVGDMNGGCEEVDFLGTAKKGGFTFPRPRWWSTEGDDE